MSDVNAAATLSLAISTGDAAKQLQELKTAYAALKGEFATGLQATGISKEAADQIQKLGQQVQTLQSNLKSMATEHQAQIAVLNSNYEKFEKARVAGQQKMADAARASTAAQSAYAANATKLLQERAAAAEVAAAAERRLAEATRANAAAAQAASQTNTARLIAERASAASGTASRSYNPLTNTYTTTPAQVAAVGTLSQNMSQVATTTKQATVEQHNWNKAAKDGHAFARGLSGSLGALWMTYGNLAPLMAGAALAGGFKAAVTAGSEFAYQLTFVKALGGETAQAVAQIGASALELSKTSMYGPGELANGLRMLSQAGLSARDSLLALPVAMNLATVGEMNMEQATLTLVGVMNAFGMGITDLTHIGDMFSKAAALSQTSVSGMTEAMKTASVVHEQYGASIEDTATAITLLAKVNIIGTAAGTSYRNMLKDLYTPSKEAARVMEDLGIKTKDALTGKLRDAPAIIADLKTKLQGFTQASQTDILGIMFSERGGKEAIQMLSAVGEEWDTLKAKISNSEGFMAGVTAELEMTTKGRFKQALNTMQANMVSAFDASEGPVRKLADALRNLADSPAFVSGINAIVGAMANMAGGLVTLTPLLVDFGMAWAVFKGVGLASAGITAASAALTGLGTSLTIIKAEAALAGGGLTGLVSGIKAATGAAGVAAGASGLGGVSALLAALASPVGIVAGATALVVGFAMAMRSVSTETPAAVKGTDDFIAALRRQNEKTDESIRKLRELIRLKREGKDEGDVDTTAMQQQVATQKAEIAKTEAALAKLPQPGSFNHMGRGIRNPNEESRARLTEQLAQQKRALWDLEFENTWAVEGQAKETVEKMTNAVIDMEKKLSDLKSRAKSDTAKASVSVLEGMIKDIDVSKVNDPAKFRELTSKIEQQLQDTTQAVALNGSGTQTYTTPESGASARAAESAAAAARRRANKDAERDEKATIASYTERQNAEIASLASRAQNKLISEEQNQAELAGIYAKYNDVIAEQYAAGTKRLKALEANAKADEKDALHAALTEMETAQAKFLADKELRLQQSKDRELGVIKATGEATKAFLEEQKAQVAAQIESINEAKAKLNMGPGESAAYDAGRKVDAEFRKKEADLKAQINNLRESLIAAQKQASGGNLSEDQIASVEGNKVLQDYLRQLQEVYDAREALKTQAMDAAEANASYTRSFEFGWKSAYKAYADEAANSASKAQIVFQSASRAMEDAVTQFVTTGKVGWRDLASTVLSEAARVMASRAVASMLGMATNFISGLFGGSSGAPDTGVGSGFNSANWGMTPSANGNVFSGAPSLHQYVNTVQDSPKVFSFDRLHKYAKGGVFAEAGPEAVMPLARDSNGRLGVRAQGGSGTDVAIYLTVNEAEGTTSAKSSGDANGAWAQFATRIKGMILEEMTNQKRPGGLLYA